MPELTPSPTATPPRSVSRTRTTQEERLTALFRRWPTLSEREVRELRRLWDDRLARARKPS